MSLKGVYEKRDATGQMKQFLPSIEVPLPLEKWSVVADAQMDQAGIFLEIYPQLAP